MTATEWAEATQQSDVTLAGLARLEREAMADAPDVVAEIEAIVAEVKPKLVAIEQERGGRQLTMRVNARLDKFDTSGAAKGCLAVVGGFIIVLLPAIWLAVMARGPWDVSDFLGWTTSLGIAAALLAIVIAIVWWREPSSLGIPVGWSVGAAVVSVLAVVMTIVRLNIDYDHGGPSGRAFQAAGIVASAVLIVFAIINVRRRMLSRRRLSVELGSDEAAAKEYLRFIEREYGVALDRIQEAIQVIPQRERNTMKDDRDQGFALWRARGWFQGQVPTVISPKLLGELQLMEITEPLVGGGQGYPSASGPARTI